MSGEQKGKEEGLGSGSSEHVLDPAPRQLRDSAHVAAASVSSFAPEVASEAKLRGAGHLWP